MITLTHGCACDVCAEEYSAQRPPHSIACGHVLCLACCTAIIEKCTPRTGPSCPFCRNTFSKEDIRVVRMDFTTSGWSTPRRFPPVEPADAITGEVLARRTERLLSAATEGMSKTRLDARRLEDKVAKVAAKKCSVEEVAALHKELEDWLLREKDDQTSSLYLSAALLRAILMNHTAHSDASKAAKSTEHTLKRKMQELEDAKRHAEGEVHRIVSTRNPIPISLPHLSPFDPSTLTLSPFHHPLHPPLFIQTHTDSTSQHAQFTAKSQECQLLRTEITQLKSLAHSLGAKPDALPPSTPHTQLPTPPSTSPTPYSHGQSYTSSSSSYFPTSSTSSSSASASAGVTPLSPVSRFHSRSSSSASAALASRPQTPAAPSMSASRSHTPSTSTSSSSSASSSASSSTSYSNSTSTPASPYHYTPTSRSSASTSMPSTPTRPSTSASMSSPVRPSTSASMASPTRTSSASASAAAAANRPGTPGYGLRSYTPAASSTTTTGGGGVPPVPTIPARYASTPGPRSHTSHGHHSSASYSASGYASAGAYAPAPLVPPKPRRLSTSQGVAHGGQGQGQGQQAVGSAPKMGRTVSEEKAEAHERWLPPGASGGGGNASFTYGSTESFRDASPPRAYGYPADRAYASDRERSAERGGYGERGIVNDYEKDPRKTPRPPSRAQAAGGAGFMGYSSAAYAAKRLKELSGRG